jgi:hypothetical protein
MINFKNLVKQERAVDPTKLLDLFNSLDRHASHIELRPVQQEALELLTHRRNERDLVLKISTGAGKTLVGLIYILSHMEEKEEPGVYLCPTIQLAEQVLEEASKLGIPAELYPPNEPHPPVDGTRGKSVIVCTYAKLFNAKTTFDRSDVRLTPCAIVLDDVHAGVEDIRNRFTLRLTSPDLVKKMLGLLSPSCASYRHGTWENLVGGDPVLSLEVPFWIWKPLVPEALKLLAPHSGEDAFMFVWPFLRDILPYCRCIVSATCIEIIPDILPIHQCRAYVQSKYRLFMSGTLADDSVLVREIGTDLAAAKNPILPQKDYGLGERMVLAPALVDKKLDRSYVMELAKTLAKRVHVVALCPSESKARDWESFGARVVLSDEVSPTIRELRDSKSKPQLVVFTQRYDGIDLPDNACRVLVIDGMPFGESLTDKYDISTKATPAGIRNRTVYRIEQGMGRAVRSHVDYAVIILSGIEIANFIAKKDVLNAMNPETRAQLQLALDLAKLARQDSPDDPEKAVRSMIEQCLRRDNDWKQYYDENVRNIRPAAKPTLDMKLEMARSEREAFELAASRSPDAAVELLRSSINSHPLSEEDKGWYLQKVAGYMYDVNPGESLEVQRAAYNCNKSLFCPPETKIKPLTISESAVQETIITWLSQFDNPNGAIAELEELKARLSYDASPESMEQALLELAPLLGAKGSRPEKEYGEGPDDLWLWPSLSLVIEAKNQNTDSLHKKDAGQLLLSLSWFEKNYSTRPTGQPIIVAKVSAVDKKSGFPSNTRVLTPEKMNLLLNNVEKFYQAIVHGMPASYEPKKIRELLPQFQLAPDQFITAYTVPIKYQ